MIKRSVYKEKINVPNSDTANVEKDKSTNTTIVNFLYELGEKSAANYLEKRIVQSAETKYSDSLNKEYTKNEKLKQKELMKISVANSGILSRLEKIEKDLVDEQDTSVKEIKKQDKKSSLEVIRNENTPKEEKGLSWFDMLLGALLGAGMLAFLKGFKNLGPVKFALKMMEMGWSWVKDKVIDLATSIAKSVMKPLEEILEFLIEKISKLPGMDGLKEKYSKKEKISEPPKGETKVNSAPDKAKVPEVDAGKLAKNTEKATAEEVAKISEKSVGKGLMKKIPFLGLGIAGAFAADRLSEGDYTGAGMEIASGILSIVPIIGTAGSVGVDVALMARDIKRANEAVITKLDNEGIIDKGWFGDTTVEKWDEVKKLPEPELKALAEYEDLSKTDRDKVQAILYKKQIEKIKVPGAPESFNDGVKIVFNEREVLADKLLESDNKLQEFLINNPFTDENSVKEEVEINGEKVKQIRFKDEELNKQYIELKEQYDRDFKKYKEARNSQLRNMKDIQEIEGELLTPEQVKTYKMSGMTMTSYSAGITKGAATTDVLNALNEQYKNVTLPTGELVDRIKKNEAIGGKPNLTAYRDTTGHMTIGYGHKIVPGEESLLNGITKEQAEAIFAKDFESHRNAAMNIPTFNEHPKYVQDALIDMTYNMGPYWYKDWPDTMKKLVAKDYVGVKNDILKSKYATQVKGRALVNAKAFEMASTGAPDTATKTASSDVSVPSKTAEAKPNINKLGKGDAVNQKQGQVQNVENINKNLVNNGRSVNTNGNTVVNNNISTQPKQEESYALTDLFGNYD